MKTKALIISMAAALCLCACSKDDDELPKGNEVKKTTEIEKPETPTEPETRHSYKPVELDAMQRDINAKMETFAWKLFKEAYINRNEGENLMISPISFAVDLGMFMNGMQGESLQELLKAMGLEDYTMEQINSYFHTMMMGIETADEAAIFKSANSFWYNQGLTASEDFLTAIKNGYNAKTEAVDYADPQTVNVINAWCAEQTNNCIKNALAFTSPEDVFHLINAVYFKAGWEDPFEERGTNKAPFVYADGSSEMVDMMQDSFATSYAETDQYKQCVRPFVDGAFKMVFILPKEGVDLVDVIPETLDYKVSATADAYPGKPKGEYVALYVPKFTSEYTANGLFGYLHHLNPDLGINWEDLSIFEPKKEMTIDAFQKTFFKMDEEGAEAAAVTVINGCTSPGPADVYVTLDHPFIYAIVEDNTQCPLFIGYYGK